jgi:alkylation response protein AidB-like acyl-CoA dehydrogenase
VILDVTDDQAVFAETTERYLARSADIGAVRAAAESDTGYERSWWRQGAEIGWTSLLVPEHLGGGSASGQGLLDLVLVMEEFGRRVAPGPILTVSAATAGIAGSVGAERHADLLGSIVSGESVVSWCAGGLFGRGDGGTPTITVAADGFQVHGTAHEVEAVDTADAFLVSSRGTNGDTQLIVPADAPGVHVTPVRSIDLTRRLGTVTFDAVAVGPESVVGRPGEAADDVERQLSTAAVLRCAELAGVAARVLEFTLEYAFDRYSFGRSLASYQALKHRFADMKVGLEATRGAAAGAAVAVADEAPDAMTLASAAISYAGEVVPQLVQDCVQMHGGIGITWEHDIHLYLRRATFDRALYGTPNDHRRRLASSLAA